MSVKDAEREREREGKQSNVVLLFASYVPVFNLN